jgi:hypothetical protein
MIGGEGWRRESALIAGASEVAGTVVGIVLAVAYLIWRVTRFVNRH